MRFHPLLLAAVGFAQKIPDSPRVSSLPMPRHSFGPMTVEQQPGADWRFLGAAVTTADQAMLLPAVNERVGHIWNTARINTRNFEIEFTFKVEGGSKTTTTGGFALWYVADYPTDFPTNGSDTLFGYKKNFAGLAVFVSNYDRNNRVNPSISASINDGKSRIDPHTGVPSNDGIYFPIRNTVEPLSLRVSVGPMGVVGQIRSGTPNWTDCFNLKTAPVYPSGGFIGFSGTNWADGDLADAVSLIEVKTSNLDLNQPGEEPVKEPEAEAEADNLEAADLLKDQGSHHDVRELSEQLRQLNRYMYKVTVENKQHHEAVHKAIGHLTQTVNQLAVDLKVARKASGDESINSEITGFKNLLTSHSKQQASFYNTLNNLHKKLDEKSSDDETLRELANRSASLASLEDTIKTQASKSAYLIFGVLCSIIVFGIWFWKRIRDMEKKHYL